MKYRIDLTGQKFGRLTVIKYISTNKYGQSRWLCLCGCGKEKIIMGNDLKNGHTKSCGCLHTKHGHCKNYKMSKTYHTWHSIIQRCTNPKDKGYKNYGGRNKPIMVCDRWSNKKNGFQNFLKDVGEIPKGKELDRTNNNKGYNPNNFRLITRKENQRNKRNNILITFNKQIRCLVEWAEILGIKYTTLYYRTCIKKWPIEKAFNTPVKKGK